ncbi:MAG: glycosyltransferase family 2 protein, partial [Deltaproteobacteria bacterium]
MTSAPAPAPGATGAGPGAGPRQRFSVALCTFEGSAHLEPQLASLAAQARLPDELVACDDRSSDGTAEILRAFARRAPFPVRVEVNETRLGTTKNFEKAIGLCTGDLIATCDQDDVWLPEKLALVEEAFARDPRLGLVFTDADIVDGSLRPMGYRLWDAIHFDGRARREVLRGRGFDVLLRQWLVTGATMAFRSEYRSLLLPIPACWVHDAWIAFLLGAVSSLGFVERPTVRYRQHPGQQVGARKFTLGELISAGRAMGPAYFGINHERIRVARDRLLATSRWVVDPGDLALVDRKLAHQARRLA